METSTFDEITRTLGSTLTRRRALRSLIAGAAATIAGGTLLQTEEVAAKRRRGKRKPGTASPQQSRPLPSGARCQSDGQCNRGQQQICEVPTNASNSDTHCCGAQGAVCGGVNADGDAIGPLCCIGEAGVRSFVCSQNDPATPNVPGTCLPAPPDL